MNKIKVEGTPQEIFDKVARHLLTQGKKSVGANDQCMYRGPDGLKCAAGCLISDDDYDPSIEGASWGVLSGDGLGLISTLQRCHDRCYVWEWPKRLREIAKDFNLSSEVVDEVQR